MQLDIHMYVVFIVYIFDAGTMINSLPFSRVLSSRCCLPIDCMCVRLSVRMSPHEFSSTPPLPLIHQSDRSGYDRWCLFLLLFFLLCFIFFVDLFYQYMIYLVYLPLIFSIITRFDHTQSSLLTILDVTWLSNLFYDLFFFYCSLIKKYINK